VAFLGSADNSKDPFRIKAFFMEGFMGWPALSLHVNEQASKDVSSF
jgi:hypothetical protein